MVMRFIAYAKTPSAYRQYRVEICKTVPGDLSAYVDAVHFSKLCESGCPNYNQKWSCPPLAPSFGDFTEGLSNLYLFYLTINMDQFSYIKNNYLKIKAANTILKSRIDKFLRLMVGQQDKYVSTGSCRLCKPCKRKQRLPCAHPDLMAYSFEALGVNVEALAKAYFNKPLLWYVRGSLPLYTSVVCGLLTCKRISLETLQTDYLARITS